MIISRAYDEFVDTDLCQPITYLSYKPNLRAHSRKSGELPYRNPEILGLILDSDAEVSSSSRFLERQSLWIPQ